MKIDKPLDELFERSIADVKFLRNHAEFEFVRPLLEERGEWTIKAALVRGYSVEEVEAAKEKWFVRKLKKMIAKNPSED